MQPATDPVIPEHAHDLVKQSLLAFQPVHRGVAEFLVDRVQVHVDRPALGENFAEQIFQVVPERIVQESGQLMGGLPFIDDVPDLAVDGPRAQ